MIDDANDRKNSIGCDQTKNNRESCSIVREPNSIFLHVRHEDLSTMTCKRGLMTKLS